MQAIHLTAPGLDNFRPVTIPDPRPQAHEVLVRLRAASLNYLDLPLALGQLPWASFPFVPVTDGAGEIAALGDGVTGWKVGDRVVPHFMPAWTAGPISEQRLARLRGVNLQGSLAEYVSVPADSLVATPEHLSDAEAATLPIAATTAWNAFKAGQVRPGSTVLLLGTGGVSSFLLAFAKAAGARVLVVSSSAQKIERFKALGASAGIDRSRTPEWDREVLALTGGHGADLVLETAWGESFRRSLEAATFGGTIFVIGFLDSTTTQLEVLPVIQKALRILGNNTGSVQDLREATQVIADRRIQPLVSHSLPLARVREAYEVMQRGEHLGKIAIDLAFEATTHG